MKGKQEEQRELWRQRIAQQEKTGQGVRSFCEERGINENAFYAWRQRFEREGKAVSFALVKTEPGVIGYLFRRMRGQCE
jgi:transposase-like protein